MIATSMEIDEMNLRKVTATIRSERLEEVEKRLQEAGVKGLSVTKVKGYGFCPTQSSPAPP